MLRKICNQKKTHVEQDRKEKHMLKTHVSE